LIEFSASKLSTDGTGSTFSPPPLESILYPDPAGTTTLDRKCLANGNVSGADPAGGGDPPKIGKNMIFWRKIVIFNTLFRMIILL
jgi:hypothetical protein